MVLGLDWTVRHRLGMGLENMRERTPEQEERRLQRALRSAARETQWQAYTGGIPVGFEAPTHIGTLNWQMMNADRTALQMVQPEAVKFADGRIVLTSAGEDLLKNARAR